MKTHQLIGPIRVIFKTMSGKCQNIARQQTVEEGVANLPIIVSGSIGQSICYSWTVLGLPPTWYTSAPYRSRIIIEPRAVLAELGVNIADDREVRVYDSNAEIRYIVLPERPVGTEGWSEERLATLVTRDSMIGTGIPLAASAISGERCHEINSRHGRNVGLRPSQARRRRHEVQGGMGRQDLRRQHPFVGSRLLQYR